MDHVLHGTYLFCFYDLWEYIQIFQNEKKWSEKWEGYFPGCPISLPIDEKVVLLRVHILSSPFSGHFWCFASLSS